MGRFVATCIGLLATGAVLAADQAADPGAGPGAALGADWAANLSIEARIERAMFGDHRAESNRARDRYRHPAGTLAFMGLQDGMTVLEIWPGGGWYTEVLAPVMRHKGQYIVASYDVDVPDQPEYRYELHMQLLDKFSRNPEVYDQVAVVPYSPPASASLGAADSIDMVLTFRNAHGWISDGIAESVFAEFARVLKPGGVLYCTEVFNSGLFTDPRLAGLERALAAAAQSADIGDNIRDTLRALGYAYRMHGKNK